MLHVKHHYTQRSALPCRTRVPLQHTASGNAACKYMPRPGYCNLAGFCARAHRHDLPLHICPQAEKQREETTEWNRGVYLATTLQPVDLDEALVAAKGIRRSKDKVIHTHTHTHTYTEAAAAPVTKTCSPKLHASTAPQTHRALV